MEVEEMRALAQAAEVDARESQGEPAWWAVEAVWRVGAEVCERLERIEKALVTKGHD